MPTTPPLRRPPNSGRWRVVTRLSWGRSSSRAPTAAVSSVKHLRPMRLPVPSFHPFWGPSDGSTEQALLRHPLKEKETVQYDVEDGSRSSLHGSEALARWAVSPDTPRRKATLARSKLQRAHSGKNACMGVINKPPCPSSKKGSATSQSCFLFLSLSRNSLSPR